MDKLTYKSFGTETFNDFAFASTNGYAEPSSELVARKQLSYPLNEIQAFANSTVPVLDSDDDTAVQLCVSSTGIKYRTTKNGTKNAITFDSTPYSFVGMVVQGTNLNDEASVKAIYGADTSWTLLSSVILASEHVFGNENALGISDGTNQYGVVRQSGGNPHPGLAIESTAYGGAKNTEYSGGSAYTSPAYSVGVATKTDLGEHPEYSGLVADKVTKAVYSWERTL